jgi:hypothetical protein
MTSAATRLERKSAMNHLRRFLGLLVAGVLALPILAVTAPAALAMHVPPGGTADVSSVPPPAQVIITGGMSGWQITLITLAAALLAALTAILLDRAWVTHHAARRTTA